MKIAIIHDWLVTYSGAERVLSEMIKCFPQSDIYTIVDHLKKEDRFFLQNRPVKTSFIQKLPFSKKHYRSYLPLMPLAIEQFDLSEYDLIISSSHAVAKGVLTGPDQIHICMCYTPIRYAWDLQHQYLAEAGLKNGLKGLMVKWLLHKIRIWDYRTSHGVDHFIAISNFIGRRIKKVYGRDSYTIYPPVDTKKFTKLSNQRKDFFVTCSRMVPYKKIDLIVETFTNFFPEKKLIVLGDGPDFKKINSLAGPNIEMLGAVSFGTLHNYLSEAKAFIFAAEEDFGIAPLEAQACGTPVIAYGRGGALETISDLNSSNPSGIFFDKQTCNSLKIAIERFEKIQDEINPENCIANANKFSTKNFKKHFSLFIKNNTRLN